MAAKALLTVADATATGNRRASLEALRQQLAVAIDAKPVARDLAALSRQLAAVLAEIDGLPESGGGSVVDDLTARRKTRRDRTAAL